MDGVVGIAFKCLCKLCKAFVCVCVCVFGRQVTPLVTRAVDCSVTLYTRQMSAAAYSVPLYGQFGDWYIGR